MQTGAQSSVRRPITIHFANMISSFLRRIGDPTPTYLKHFIKTGINGKKTPKWYS